MATPRARRKARLEHHAEIEDPRDPGRVAHPRPEVLLLVMCGTIRDREGCDLTAAWDADPRQPVMICYAAVGALVTEHAMKSLSYSIAPEQLWQAINPWTFYQQGMQVGLINIDLGSTPAPETEQKILDDVGSYGRQIGRIGDALEVLLRHVPLQNLSREEQDALDVLKGQLAEVRAIKQRAKA